MISTRRISFRFVFISGARIITMASIWSILVYFAYTGLKLTFIRLPFLPIGTIGTAVALYIGFKNNSAYDRFWEGRKIWGGIVNVSRAFAAQVIAHVDEPEGTSTLNDASVRRELVMRHLAWINALRLQLRRTSRFFDKPAKATEIRLRKHAEHMRNDWDKELAPFLSAEELTYMSARKNTASHLILKQTELLASLQKEGRLDIFHQLALNRHMDECLTLQGKCERIKNTPLPRWYAEYSRIFTRVYVLMMPFGLLDVFAERIAHAQGEYDTWISVLPMIFCTALVSWIFTMIEGIGDASEDPFERSMNDVPMNALCRTIEIDLREFLGETDLPPKEETIDGLLY